jgi:hypothetical protein
VKNNALPKMSALASPGMPSSYQNAHTEESHINAQSTTFRHDGRADQPAECLAAVVSGIRSRGPG